MPDSMPEPDRWQANGPARRRGTIDACAANATGRRAAAVNAVLLLAAVIFFLAGLMARIDSREELFEAAVMDVVNGLMLAASFVLAREAKPVPRPITFAVAVGIWLLSSGLLLSWHAWQVHLRTTVARRSFTHNRIRQTYEALEACSGDCGAFPSAAQSLDALFDNFGSARWKGPYLADKSSVLDAWGRRLRYAVRHGKPVVWSCGADGVSGTDDDIARTYEEAAGGAPQR